MANHPSAEKRNRQNERRRTKNRIERSSFRTAMKKARSLAEQNQVEAAQAEAKKATRLLDKAVSHGVLKRQTASRYISRLQQHLNRAAQA